LVPWNCVSGTRCCWVIVIRSLEISLTRDIDTVLNWFQGLEQKERANSRRRDLYRNLLRDGFLVGWFKLVGFKVLIGRIPFLHDQILASQNFVRDSYVRLALSATKILSYGLLVPFLLVE